MIVSVHNNMVYCQNVNTRINHMECDDECCFFQGCAVVSGKFVIDCGYNRMPADINEEKIELIKAGQ